MQTVGWILIVGGLLLGATGIAMMVLAVVQLGRQMFKPSTDTRGGGVDIGNVTKLIEALVKLPQWLLALLAGDVQVWLGYWLATGTRLF